jgi:hypothetical protein
MVYLLISLVLGLVALGLLRWWVLARLDLSHVLSTRDARPTETAKVIDSLGQKIHEGELPSIKEDFSTVGSPTKEALLLELRRFMQVFEAGFRRPSKDSAELGRLITEGSLSKQQKSVIRREIRQCQIFTLPENSYLLNCDGWGSTDPENVNRLVQKLDKQSERFYINDGHVFLYSPPLTSPSPGAVRSSTTR